MPNLVSPESRLKLAAMGVETRQPAKRNIVFLQLAIIVFVLGLILIIIGAVLIAESQRPVRQPPEDGCKPSTEADRTGLFTFLKQVEDVYYKFKPYKVGSKPGVTAKEVREIYRAYDPSPSNLKVITDHSLELLREINVSKSIDEDELKPRERRMLAQVKFFLKHIFGSPYEGDFYNGDFMLGPNIFCASPICKMGKDLEAVLPSLKPSSVGEVRFLRDKLKEFNTTIYQYISNLREGVKAGFVRPILACKAGLDALRTKYPKLWLQGEQGIVNETFAQLLFKDDFTSEISSSIESDWKKENEGSVKDSLSQFMVEYVGRSFVTLMSYLETEHMTHCVPSDVSSGLSNLPLPFVYLNGTKTSEETTNGKLPGTELRVTGKELYENTLHFFTTVDMTPDEVYDLGWAMLNKLYPEVIEIAKNDTSEANNNTAKSIFITRLGESRWYFNEGMILPDESNEEAHKKCVDMETAAKHCSQRLGVIQKWFDEAMKVMALIAPKTSDLFHFAGKRATTPNCPVIMEANFNPAAGYQSYLPADALCTKPASYRLPFWKQRPGPSWEEWGVNSHEARPGHHTQVVGYFQNFQDNCGTPLSKQLNDLLLFRSFIEGWGLYAERPLMADDTDLYKDVPNSQYYRYGTLKWQIWRAIRLIVDTCLHYKGCSREWALQLLADRGWDTTDFAKKEVTRYQSAFGQATAYMVGQQRIIKMRDYAKEQLKDKFNIKDFHFFLLYQGGVPLDYLEESIKRYVSCVKDDSLKGCADVLDPLKNVKAGVNYREMASSFQEEYVLPV